MFFFLICSSLFAQIQPDFVIEANNRNIETIAREIIMDWETYNNGIIVIYDVVFTRFRIRSNRVEMRPYLSNITWRNYFDNPEVVHFEEYGNSFLESNRFSFWFHANRREDRPFIYSNIDTNYVTRQTVTIAGFFCRFRDGGSTSNVFIILQCTIGENMYFGGIPMMPNETVPRFVIR